VRVIPVIDLKGGLVVRGVGGRRDQYQPIDSKLAADARPRTVARALAEQGFRETYLADLDAIAGAPPAWRIYDEVLDCGLALLVDAGVSSVERARELARFEPGGRRLQTIVVGLETLPGPGVLAEILRAVGTPRLVFSLDMKSGVPLTGLPAWRGLAPPAIAAIALRIGVRRMIVLDLAAVGMNQGVSTLPLCRALRCLDPTLEIITGGGVRGPADLAALAATGANAALVASALHDGRLTPGQCASPLALP
jgi:phosphoribosylformimino-5-aminoimidazole carboxamide ribotide isomerase